MRTEALISLLAQDAPASGNLSGRLSARLALAFLAGGALASLLFAIGVGFRPDLAAVAHSARFLFKLAAALLLLVAAAGAVREVGRPDARLAPWGFALGGLLALLGGAVAAELVVTPQAQWGARLVGRNAAFCMVVIPTLAAAPLALLLYALRAWAPARPGLAGAIAGLAASGIAATLYATHCPDDSPLFVATWYSLATGLVVAAGAAIGSRLLRW